MSATLFSKLDLSLSTLISEIASGQLGLPDIQRPFVWKNVEVRNLFDSLYRGYPIGYLLFWDTGVRPGTRQIGKDDKQLAATRVIVDGQQRLTSLYAVLKGVPVIRSNFSTEQIEIAFNPLDGRFEVPDAAIRRDKRFIPNISAVWSPSTNLIKFAGEYVRQLTESGQYSDGEIDSAQAALGRLFGLVNFPFTVLVLSAQAEADQVSEIFVRINSQGKKLNQSDFILTLMSVFWDEGRRELEEFCRQSRIPSASASSFNYLFRPEPDQLLRVAIAVGLRRARLSAVYAILRGSLASQDQELARSKRFEFLKKGQGSALNVQYWHDFLRCVSLAGFRSPRIISSENALVFAYALYLIGRTELGVEEHILRKAIAQWLFMSSLTGRFTTSPESKMEFDLASLRVVETPDQFVSAIQSMCASALTNDFWSITLPNALATSASQSPSMFAFFAALNVLDARALYSSHTVRELMEPAVRGSRSSLERHHLFPVNYLKNEGVDDQRARNQIANYAIVEWTDNASISDASPSSYIPALEVRFSGDDLRRMYEDHALPEGWADLPYDLFLKERRSLIARTIRRAYESLAGEQRTGTSVVNVDQIVQDGESDAVEFKSTLVTNLHTGESDPRMETAVIKSVAGFLNTSGGTLIIGVADDGSPIGFDLDRFRSEDKALLHLINLLKDRIGGQHAMNVRPRFEDFEGKRVLVVSCDRSRSPVYVKDGPAERFFVRYGPSTQELTGAAAQSFIRQRYQ